MANKIVIGDKIGGKVIKGGKAVIGDEPLGTRSRNAGQCGEDVVLGKTIVGDKVMGSDCTRPVTPEDSATD